MARLTTLVSGSAGLHEGAVEPVARLLPGDGGADLLIAFEVVADDQAGAMGAEAATADALAGAEGFEGDAIGKDDGAASPDRSPARRAGVGGGKCWIGGEFIFDVFEVGMGLAAGVGEDPDVGLAAFEGFAQGVGECSEGRLGGAAGREDIELAAGVTWEVIELECEPAVHFGGGAGEVVGKKILGPPEEVGGGGLCGRSAGAAVTGCQVVADCQE